MAEEQKASPESKSISDIIKVAPQTSSQLRDGNVSVAAMFNHGYFPKEVARYLLNTLRSQDVPCELGFDRKLSDSNDEIARELKDRFKESRPFYFLAFPMEYRMKAREVLKGTQFPLPDASETEQEFDQIIEKRKTKGKPLTNLTSIIITLVLFGAAIYALILIGKMLMN